MGIANKLMNFHRYSQQPFALVFDFSALFVDNLNWNSYMYIYARLSSNYYAYILVSGVVHSGEDIECLWCCSECVHAHAPGKQKSLLDCDFAWLLLVQCSIDYTNCMICMRGEIGSSAWYFGTQSSSFDISMFLLSWILVFDVDFVASWWSIGHWMN